MTFVSINAGNIQFRSLKEDLPRGDRTKWLLCFGVEVARIPGIALFGLEGASEKMTSSYARVIFRKQTGSIWPVAQNLIVYF